MNANNNYVDVMVLANPVVIDLVGGPVLGRCTICVEHMLLWADPPSQGEVSVSPNTGCGHVFHQKCLQGWLNSGGTNYPNCNAAFTAWAVMVE